MKKWLILILFCIGGASWWFFKKNKDEKPQFLTNSIISGDLTQIVTASGTLNPVMNVQVGSQISGNIQKLFADYNSSVKAGQVVAQLDPAIYQAIVQQAEGDLANAQAALELARLTANRTKDLASRRVVSESEMDNALATLHQAEAMLKIKEANLAKAKVDLDRCTIYSPIDGTVISRNVDVGQTVAATLNAPVLFTIANDLTKMQINANVAEADVGNVEVGQDVDFTVDAFPYQTFHGKVAQVRNAAMTVQNVVTYDVIISVNNPDLKLKPGMTANVSIVIARRENIIKLPNAALRFRLPENLLGNSPTQQGMSAKSNKHSLPNRAERIVYLLSSPTSQPQPITVRLGISDGTTTEVLEGLKEGDQVITGMITPKNQSAQNPTNPLSGGMRMRRI